MLKRTFTVIITVITVILTAGEIGPEIKKITLVEVNPSAFLLTLEINDPLHSDAGGESGISVPSERYILQGPSDRLNERDTLFSQTDADLDGDSKISASFRVEKYRKNLLISGRPLSPLIKESANYRAVVPRNRNGSPNLNRIGPKGIGFTLRGITGNMEEMIIGLNPEGDVTFRSLPNYSIQVEIIVPDHVKVENMQIDEEKPVEGRTNEKSITGGETRRRFFVFKSPASSPIKISGVHKPFSVRVTYYHALSENMILIIERTAVME